MSAAKTRNTTINQLTLSGRKKRRTLNGHLIIFSTNCFCVSVVVSWYGCDDVAVVMVLRCAKKGGKEHCCAGRFQRNMSLVLPTYVGRHRYDIFFFSARHSSRNRYFSTTFDSGCRDMSAPFWVNADMSDMSDMSGRQFQLRHRRIIHDRAPGPWLCPVVGLDRALRVRPVLLCRNRRLFELWGPEGGHRLRCHRGVRSRACTHVPS